MVETVDEAKNTAESNAAMLSNIEERVTFVLEKQYENRRKSWTLSNDLARIEGKIDKITERVSE